MYNKLGLTYTSLKNDDRTDTYYRVKRIKYIERTSYILNDDNFYYKITYKDSSNLEQELPIEIRNKIIEGQINNKDSLLINFDNKSYQINYNSMICIIDDITYKFNIIFNRKKFFLWKELIDDRKTILTHRYMFYGYYLKNIDGLTDYWNIYYFTNENINTISNNKKNNITTFKINDNGKDYDIDLINLTVKHLDVTYDIFPYLAPI